MKVLFVFVLLLILLSCTAKKDSKKRLLPEGIKSATEEKYTVVNSQKKLLYKKEMIFTGNGRIRYSKTVDSTGNLLQETKKKLWFVVESYPDREPCYCKTRWKPKQRERISCYTRKQYKQNESIYHYNTDGTIDKITDNFSTFYTQNFYYANKELSRIVVKDKNDKVVDEFSITCAAKDEKGACLKEIRSSAIANTKEEILFFPKYD